MLNNHHGTVVTRQENRTKQILDKLRERAEQIGYGTVVCELQVHQGKIKQVEITTIKERMRADYD